MNCVEFDELLFSYIDGELSELKNKDFQEHIKNCTSCKKQYEAYKKMIDDIHALPLEELPKGYCKRLHGKLEEAKVSKIKRRRNNYLKYLGIAASFVLIISAVYFRGNNFNGLAKNQATEDSKSDYDMAMDRNSESMPQEFAGIVEESADNSNDSLMMANQKSMFTQQQMESKIIKSGRLNIETLDFDKFVEELNQLVKGYNGYIEFNETFVRYKTEDKEFKNANIKLRVPQETFYDVVNFIDSQAEVYNRNINETDVTKEYYDTQNVLDNLQIQENRLRELYNKAETITDILALENEIRRIRTEIDAYSINLSDIDDRVSMATIELSINEVEGKNINMLNSKGLWGKSKEGFVRTVNNILDLIESIIVWFISYLPIIISLLIIGFIVYKVVKKKIRS